MKKCITELIGAFALVFCGTGAIIINRCVRSCGSSVDLSRRSSNGRVTSNLCLEVDQNQWT